MRKYTFRTDKNWTEQTFNYTGFDHNWRDAEYVAIVPIEDTYECYGLDSPEDVAELNRFMIDSGTIFLPIKILHHIKYFISA